MNTIPQVDLDKSGRFKYVMMKIIDSTAQDTRIVIRGFQWANYHIDLVEHFERSLNKPELKHLVFSCVGGGRIYYDPEKKVMKIYGRSEAYGRADHEATARLIRAQQMYKNVNVTWSNEDYEPDTSGN